jgi:hypothetical protein
MVFGAHWGGAYRVGDKVHSANECAQFEEPPGDAGGSTCRRAEGSMERTPHSAMTIRRLESSLTESLHCPADSTSGQLVLKRLDCRPIGPIFPHRVLRVGGSKSAWYRGTGTGRFPSVPLTTCHQLALTHPRVPPTTPTSPQNSPRPHAP